MLFYDKICAIRLRLARAAAKNRYMSAELVPLAISPAQAERPLDRERHVLQLNSPSPRTRPCARVSRSRCPLHRKRGSQHHVSDCRASHSHTCLALAAIPGLQILRDQTVRHCVTALGCGGGLGATGQENNPFSLYALRPLLSLLVRQWRLLEIHKIHSRP